MRNRRSLVYKISLLVMVVSFLGVATLSFLLYEDTKEIFLQNSAQKLEQKAQDYIQFLQNRFDTLQDNVVMLASNPLVEGLMRAYTNPYHYDSVSNKTFAQYQKDVQNLLRLLLKQSKNYFQVRILSLDGKEVLKLVKKQGKVIVVRQLQNKAHRDYFQEIVHLPNDSIYFSKIDLNKEFHTLEFPLKVTLRVGKIITYNGKKIGIVLINVDVKKLFNLKQFMLHGLATASYIANQEGYYIFNEETPYKEFGFEFGKEYSILKDFPFVRPLFGKERHLLFIKRSEVFEADKMVLPNGRFLVIMHRVVPASFFSQARHYITRLILYIVAITFGITILTILLVRWFTKPIIELTAIAQEIARTKGEKDVPIRIQTGDEIEELANAMRFMLERLLASKKELASFAQKLESEVEKKTAQLQRLNENLQKMVEQKVEEIRQKDRALMQQSKLAQMGEMIGAIAHQWRQPLNSLALYIQSLVDQAENGELTQKSLEEFEQKSMETIGFMSKTIDDFRNFFKKDKEKTRFNIKDVVNDTLRLQKAQLENHGIAVRTKLEDVEIEGYKNEFMQVLLNLISNARDAIEEHTPQNGVIEIEVKKKSDEAIVRVRDNGGGIAPAVMERIFEPYFSTKDDDKGTGIGLYMSKDILERMGGKIEVKNVDGGAEFTIRLKAEDAHTTK